MQIGKQQNILSLQNSISFWCDTVVGFYSLKPVIIKYLKKNYKLYIYVEEKDMQIIRSYIGKNPNIEFISIQSINNFLLSALNYFLKHFFTNPNFSVMYSRISAFSRFKFYCKYFGIFFFFRNEKLNENFDKIFSLFKCKIKGNILISISRIKANHLLCTKNIKHISIMESWDHPVKCPYWHKPHVILTWNKFLKNDYKDVQKFRGTKISYIKPLKFRYINERLNCSVDTILSTITNPLYLEDLKVLQSDDYFVYITTTSSLNKIAHEGEIKLIRQITKALELIGKKLYIKPKPNGPTGDYDFLLNEFDNVYVGVYAFKPNFQDLFSEEYNSFRYLLLIYCSVVINFGTTFVLEASLLDKPIFQLDIDGEFYGIFGDYSNNLHIKKYLLGNFSFKVTCTEDILSALKLKEKKFMKYSENLKNWISEK